MTSGNFIPNWSGKPYGHKWADELKDLLAMYTIVDDLSQYDEPHRRLLTELGVVDVHAESEQHSVTIPDPTKVRRS